MSAFKAVTSGSLKAMSLGYLVLAILSQSVDLGRWYSLALAGISFYLFSLGLVLSQSWLRHGNLLVDLLAIVLGAFSLLSPQAWQPTVPSIQDPTSFWTGVGVACLGYLVMVAHWRLNRLTRGANVLYAIVTAYRQVFGDVPETKPKP